MSAENAQRRRGILDTSTLLLLHRVAEPDVLPSTPLITAVTLAELTVGPLVAKTDAERAHRQRQVQQAEANFAPLPFDDDAARAFAQVAASMHHSGRKATARTFDAMIAAVALARGLPVFTCNQDDFAGIERLEVVPVAIAAA